MARQKLRRTERIKAGWDHSLGAAKPARDVVAHRAYQIWQDRGCPEGTAVEDWLQAEAEMRYAASFRFGRPERRPHATPGSCNQVDEASEQSFPASDPPASTHCTIT